MGGDENKASVLFTNLESFFQEIQEMNMQRQLIR